MQGDCCQHWRAAQHWRALRSVEFSGGTPGRAHDRTPGLHCGQCRQGSRSKGKTAKYYVKNKILQGGQRGFARRCCQAAAQGKRPLPELPGAKAGPLFRLWLESLAARVVGAGKDAWSDEGWPLYARGAGSQLVSSSKARPSAALCARGRKSRLCAGWGHGAWNWCAKPDNREKAATLSRGKLVPRGSRNAASGVRVLPGSSPGRKVKRRVRDAAVRWRCRRLC